MRYPGGKGKTYQHIINLMPRHRVYVETHLGGGAVLRNKQSAARTIGIDADERVVKSWLEEARLDVELVCGRAEDFLRQYPFEGDELLYVDPPYHPATRRQQRVYRHDYTEQDHVQLAELLSTLPCMVILSGYGNPIYDGVLANWKSKTFSAKTHTDVRLETLWFNFDAPVVLHDSRHVGRDFRERQSNKRRMHRLRERVHGMDPVERAAFSQWLHEAYPLEAMDSTP